MIVRKTWLEKQLHCPENEPELAKLLESKTILEPVDYSRENIVLKFRGFDIDEKYATVNCAPNWGKKIRQEIVHMRLCEVEAALEMTGEELHAHCIALGITEEWLAQVMNVQPEDVVSWMDGRSRIPVDAAMWVIRSYGVTDGHGTPNIDMETFDSVFYLIKFRSVSDLWRYQPFMGEWKISLPMHEKILENLEKFVTRFTDGETKLLSFDTADYELWRNGRVHNEKLVQEWAAQCCQPPIQ